MFDNKHPAQIECLIEHSDQFECSTHKKSAEEATSWLLISWIIIPVNMPIVASTGPVLVRCWQHRPSIGPVLAHNGMFMGMLKEPNNTCYHWEMVQIVTKPSNLWHNPINMPLCASTGPMLTASAQYRPGTGMFTGKFDAFTVVLC